MVTLENAVSLSQLVDWICRNGGMYEASLFEVVEDAITYWTYVSMAA
jgi:hypothetical protein